MADAAVATIISEGPDELVLRLNCISDGTGEANVAKLDKSTLKSRTGAEPTALDIKAVRWCMQGFTYVKLSWDHAADSVGYVLSGNGVEDANAMPDPKTADSTGDLLLTSVGAASGATYDITLRIAKRA